MPYYAVVNGRDVGIFRSWPDCEEQVKGYSRAYFRKFYSIHEARDFLFANGVDEYWYSSSESSGSDEPYYPNKRFKRDHEGFVIVYTDGACLSNGRYDARAGIGVYWGENHVLNVSEPVIGRATNNCGEIQAATKAIKLALANGINKLAIHTDSKFLIRAVTEWMPGWINHGWIRRSGERVKNEKDFKELNKVLHKLNTKWCHVEAHSGDYGNEMADQLAREGAELY